MHKPDYKATVVLTAIQGELTMAKKFKVQATQITQWKKQLLGGVRDLFGKGVKVAEVTEKTVQQPHAKIGRLAIVNVFLEHGLKRTNRPV